jgi:hypothetical protein
MESMVCGEADCHALMPCDTYSVEYGALAGFPSDVKNVPPVSYSDVCRKVNEAESDEDVEKEPGYSGDLSPSRIIS